jgi:hypothetical protein
MRRSVVSNDNAADVIKLPEENTPFRAQVEIEIVVQKWAPVQI